MIKDSFSKSDLLKIKQYMKLSSEEKISLLEKCFVLKNSTLKKDQEKYLEIKEKFFIN